MKNTLQYILAGDAAAISARLSFPIEQHPPRVSRLTAWLRSKLATWRDQA